jgi:ribosomal protein S18 acetylase RimI-like enzyme
MLPRSQDDVPEPTARRSLENDAEFIRPLRRPFQQREKRKGSVLYMRGNIIAATPRAYPWASRFGDRLVTVRLMRAEDEVLFKDFIRSLPHKDNYYLLVDVHNDQAIDIWTKGVESGHTLSVIALEDDRMVGYCNLHTNELPWTRHTGEIRMSVSTAYRGRGLGRALANEVFALARAHGLQKLWVRMAAGQEAAQSVFHSLGFHTEALLSDFVKNENGLTEDLVIMSYDAGQLWGL